MRGVSKYVLRKKCTSKFCYSKAIFARCKTKANTFLTKRSGLISLKSFRASNSTGRYSIPFISPPLKRILFRKSSLKRIDERVCYVSTLPYKQQKLLTKYVNSLNATKECVDANSRVIEKMLSNEIVNNLFINSKSNIEQEELSYIVQDPDSDKVHITLKQIARDWSDLGAGERDQCYKPCIDELLKHFDPTSQKHQFRVVSNNTDIFEQQVPYGKSILAGARGGIRQTCL